MLNKKIISFLLLIVSIFVFSIINTNATSSYKINEVITKDLGYGVTLEEVICETKVDNNEFNNLDGRSQHIYTASIAKGSKARVVQYSFVYNGENKISSGSIKQIASKYQKDHPNQMVLCATNNWLAWVDRASYGEYRGVQVSQGLNYRMSDIEGTSEYHLFQSMGSTDTCLGFDREGNMIFNDNYQKEVNATKTMMLSYYSQATEDKIELNIPVDKVNIGPEDGEVSIIMSNYGGTQTKFEGAKIYKMKGLIIRHDDHKTSGEDQKERDAFALGDYVQMVDEVVFSKEDPLAYYFVSKNSEFDKLDFENHSILSQYEFIGDMKGIFGATPYFQRIVKDGEIVKGDAYCHPRTVFIQKTDGSYALSVIDGRQEKIGRTGMCYEEMAWFYKNQYNAYQCFNYDGGGSSAMVIRGKNDTFQIINSPSDGSARGIANITMIVVDKPNFDIKSNETDTSISIEVTNNDENITKIVAKLSDKTYEIIDGKLELTNLTPNTEYNISFDYYVKDSEELNEGIKYTTSTTPLRATLDHIEFKQIDQNTLSFIMHVKDEEKTFYSGQIFFEDKVENFTLKNEEIIFNDLKANTTYPVKVVIKSTSSSPNIRIEEEYNFNTEYKTPKATYPEEITINVDKFSIGLKETLNIDVELNPSDTTTEITYSSSNESVAAIDENGKITPIAVGTTTITATTKEGITDSFKLTVTEESTPSKPSGCKNSFIISYLLISSMLAVMFLKKHN